VGAVEFLRQGEQGGLGFQCGVRMVGVGHLTAYTTSKPLRQMIFHVSNPVNLAALNHRMVEHVEHRLAQRLGPVDACSRGSVCRRSAL